MDEKFNALDCHFTWNLTTENSNDKEPKTLIEYLDVDIQMNDDIELQALTYKAYLLHTLKDSDAAVNILNNVIDKCIKHVNSPHAKGNQYISLANLAWIKRDKDKTEVQDIFKKIELLTPLQDGAAALVWGSKGYALHLGGKNKYAEALNCYKRAFSLEKDHFGWPLGIAILAGRLRRILEGGTTQPTELEQDTLMIAAELSKFCKALPIVLMADLFFTRGRSFKVISQEKDEELLSCAKKLYQKAYNLSPKSSHILNRCGKAFSVMGEKELAEKYLNEAVNLNPVSSVCNHRLGQFYEHQARDFEQAKIYYEKAVSVSRDRNLYAELDLTRIKRRLDSTFDVIRHLSEMKLEYRNDPEGVAQIDCAIQKQQAYDDAQASRQQAGNVRGQGARGRGRGGRGGRGLGRGRGNFRDGSADSRYSLRGANGEFKPRDGSTDSRLSVRNDNTRPGYVLQNVGSRNRIVRGKTDGLLGASPFDIR